MRIARLTLAGLLLLCFAPLAKADELLGPDRELPEVIDHYVNTKLAKRNISPAPLADDATLLRRTLLDLAGRIPTATEAQAYLANTNSNKRIEMVDRALTSPGFVRQQVDQFDTMLASEGKRNLREYLTLALAENRPWDQIFRELVAADDTEPARKGAGQFLKARVNDIDRLANETSVAFFGVNISCAKCHDHPLVVNWTQDHFYGMASFFNRTFENGEYVAERDYGRMSYQTTTGENRTAKLMFLTGLALDEPEVEEPKDDEKKKEKERWEQLKKDKQRPPPPSFSRRAQLIEVALQPEQRHYFAKSIVNQLWNRFYGHGLVMPIDQMHPENPASHPELLDWLARDLVEHKYDLRRLIRGLVLSEAYARSSRWDQGERPNASLFAVANVRPLMPAQYGAVLGMGSTSPEQFPLELKPQDFDQRLQRAEGQGRGVVEKLEQPRDGFQISVDEALLFTNGERILRDVLRDSKDTVIGHAKSQSDRHAAIEMLIWNTLTRPADSEEVGAMETYLTKRSDRLDDAWQQLVWALLTSSEARFNY